jgi:hypothetical protein
VLAVASLGAAVAFVDATIVNIAFPDIARSFPGTSTSTLSWVFNAYNVILAAFLMAAAGIADLLGRRPRRLIQHVQKGNHDGQDGHRGQPPGCHPAGRRRDLQPPV